MSKYIVEEISKRYPITAYLDSCGVSPRRDSEGKSVYHCPLPSHPGDRTPSFYVYDKGDHEDYYCYGCKSGGSVIQLVAAMEHLSVRDAISKLSNSLNIDIADVIDSVVREVIQATGGAIDDTESVLQLVMYVSSFCHDFLSRTEFDPAEISICDKLSELCDNLMKSRDRKGLEQVMNTIPTKLGQRYRAWLQKKKEEERKSAVAWHV